MKAPWIIAILAIVIALGASGFAIGALTRPTTSAPPVIAVPVATHVPMVLATSGAATTLPPTAAPSAVVSATTVAAPSASPVASAAATATRTAATSQAPKLLSPDPNTLMFIARKSGSTVSWSEATPKPVAGGPKRDKSFVFHISTAHLSYVVDVYASAVDASTAAGLQPGAMATKNVVVTVNGSVPSNGSSGDQALLASRKSDLEAALIAALQGQVQVRTKTTYFERVGA